MSERGLAVLTIIAALGSAVSGGVLFGFSSFIMAALARLPAQQGIAAMQAINITVINLAFMTTFFGTGLVCLILSVSAGLARGWASAGIVAAGLIYVLGCLGVTVACNVPLNEALAKLGATAPEADAYWSMYLRNWTQWNHVRTAAAILASLMLIWALRAPSIGAPSP